MTAAEMEAPSRFLTDILLRLARAVAMVQDVKGGSLNNSPQGPRAEEEEMGVPLDYHLAVTQPCLLG